MWVVKLISPEDIVKKPHSCHNSASLNGLLKGQLLHSTHVRAAHCSAVCGHGQAAGLSKAALLSHKSRHDVWLWVDPKYNNQIMGPPINGIKSH